MWIKLHRSLLDDYEFACLPVASRALAPLLWLLASEYEGGQISLSTKAIAFRLRMSERELIAALNPLIESGFFVDDSNALAGRYHDAIPEREIEREIEIQDKTEKDIRAVASATRPANDDFEEFWKAYPRRKGANPKAPARKLFDAAVKQGADPKAIVAGALRCAEQDRDKIGTEYIPQGVKWLRDRRWEDYLSGAEADNKRIADAERELAAKGWFKNSETNQWEHRGQP